MPAAVAPHPAVRMPVDQRRALPYPDPSLDAVQPRLCPGGWKPIPLPRSVCRSLDHQHHRFSLECGLNFRRRSGMNRSSQERVTVQDHRYTDACPWMRAGAYVRANAHRWASYLPFGRSGQQLCRRSDQIRLLRLHTPGVRVARRTRACRPLVHYRRSRSASVRFCRRAVIARLRPHPDRQL